MIKSLLTLALAFVLSTSANAFEVNGFISGSYFTSSQALPYARQETGVGVHHNINENIDVYGSVYASDKHSYLSSAFVEFTFPMTDYVEFTIDVGRIRNCYCLYNYTRLQPATRDQIVLPQAIYWSGLDDFANYTDGISAKVKIANLIALTASSGEYKISHGDLASNYLLTPAIIEEKNHVEKYGVAIDKKWVLIGGQKIKWEYTSQFAKEQWATVDSYYVRLQNEKYSMSYETIEMHTKMGDEIGMKPAIGYSLTGTMYFDKYSIFANKNTIDYQAPFLLDFIAPGKNKTTDKSVGVRYRYDKNITLKTEYHWVDGNSYNLPATSPALKDSYLASQVIYSF